MSVTMELPRTMINFISAATLELMLALFFVSRKQMNFMVMLFCILLIPSMNLNYTHLTEVNLLFNGINQ